MTAPSPTAGGSGLVSFEIKSAGKKLPDTAQVISIDTWVSVNRVPRARILLFDGSPTTGDFELSATDTLLPGKEIEIALGYKSQNTTVFKGVIIRHGIEIDRDSGSRLVIEVADKSLGMTLQRKSAVFEKIKDGALIEQLIGATSGLTATVTATTVEHERVVQHDVSDWDMMVMRAELNGYVVTVDSGTVTVGKPDPTTAAVLALTFGDTIYDFDAELDAPSQLKKDIIKSYGWDAATQALLTAGAGSASALATPGNVGSDDLAKVFGLSEFAHRTGALVAKDVLEGWSGAELVKASLAKVRGSVRFPGSALAKVGKTIELAKVGPRFNGTAYVSGVHHHVADGAWLTTVGFGLSPNWFASESHAIPSAAAAGHLAPIKGLHTGTVKQVHKDESGNYRVLVKLPLLNAADKGVWARLASFYASSGFGAVFFPETDDEVVVGFMNEDPRFPVILGSLYGKARAPAFPPEEKNEKKALTTRTKLQITFDEKDKIIEVSTPGKHTLTMDDKTKGITIKDTAGNTVSLADKGVITIKTPGGHSITMDDQGKEVKIKDSTGNSLTMASGGVTLESASNMTLSAKGNVSVKATGNIALAATGNATMEGMQVTHTAKTKFAAQGSASAEVKGSGMLTLSGGIVKIN